HRQTPRVTRAVLLTEIPAPYRIPLFNALAEQADLHVVFLRERNPERPYALHRDEFRFASHVLRGRDFSMRGRWIVLNVGTTRALEGLRPDVVIVGGWNEPAFWTSVTWAKLRRVPTILWAESTRSDRRSGRLDGLKRMLLRQLDAF